MFRISGVAMALSLTIAWAMEETPTCTGEASLLQKQHQRSRHVGFESHGAIYEDIPEKVLESMIVSNPWNCGMLPPFDPRRPTCGVSFAESGLHPLRMTQLGNKSHDHMNSVRMLFPVGALPCCTTAPFCSAPACASRKSKKFRSGKCSKRSAAENLAYIKHPAVWPAYHGWGGSYEMDVQKHYDILGNLLRKDGRVETFDLVIDIGANSGYITEKLTTRHFAKDYILVEAYLGMKQLYETRFGDAAWKKKWFEEQVPKRLNATVPNFEFLNVAVNDHSGGSLDLCVDNMWSNMNKNQPCPVDKVALDSMIPDRLSSSFQSSFAAAESAYVKIDVEGMDEKALRGMPLILDQERGTYSDGSPRHLVNFLVLEYCDVCQFVVKANEKLENYDLKTTVQFLESMGFETFLVGPNYVPLSHGSWDDSINDFIKDRENSFGGTNYAVFEEMTCPGADCAPPKGKPEMNRFTADLFAIRTTHPMATKIKVALGACKESHDFSATDKQYEINVA